MEFKDVKYNGSGIYDPTAFEAICRVDGEHKRVMNLIKHLQKDCHDLGYEIEGRIILRNKKTGRTWR